MRVCACPALQLLAQGQPPARLFTCSFSFLTHSSPPFAPRCLPPAFLLPHSTPQLLGGLLEVNLAFVRDVEVLGLAPLFFDFLSLEHSNNNVHNIRLCRQLIAAGSLTVEQIMEMQVRLVTCQDCMCEGVWLPATTACARGDAC